jgi:hypothetical protein
VLRDSADRLFRLTPRTKNFPIIPDLTTKKDSANFYTPLFDVRNIATALGLTVFIHLIDMQWQFYYFWHGRNPSWRPLAPPSPLWDWTAWFLTDPTNRRLYTENLILVIVAYISQFLMVLFAISLIIVILRHNLYYLDTVYLRSRPGAADTGSFIVLDFKDGNGRFGMSGLERRFNVTIRLLSFAGIFTLLSRLNNAPRGLLDVFVSKIKVEQLVSGKFAESLPFDLLPALFPTAGQRMFAIVWLLMFFVVLLPARAKLLPIHYDKRNARDYLLEFIPPGSAVDTDTNSLASSSDLGDVAKYFAAQAFWPAGNSQAEFLSVGAFFVFFLILGPALRFSFVYILYYVVLLGAAYTASKVLFWYFRYRLYSVSEILVKKDSAEK